MHAPFPLSFCSHYRYMHVRCCDLPMQGIMKDGDIVCERGYGWKDRLKRTSMPPDGLMRIASVTKPVTAAAIHKLVAAGKFGLTDKVFSLGLAGGGLLDHTPFPSLGDQRLKDVTVQHCLDHKGGWDRSTSVGDITYKETTIATAMKVANPPGLSNTMRWILGQPLQLTPGSKYAYSNVGSWCLG